MIAKQWISLILWLTKSTIGNILIMYYRKEAHLCINNREISLIPDNHDIEWTLIFQKHTPRQASLSFCLSEGQDAKVSFIALGPAYCYGFHRV